MFKRNLTHLFCSSVSSVSFAYNSFSLLYLAMITPIDRFRKKKFPMMITDTKNKHVIQFKEESSRTTKSLPLTLAVKYIMSLHTTELDIINRLAIDLRTSSKFKNYCFHAAPVLRQSHLFSMFLYSGIR